MAYLTLIRLVSIKCFNAKAMPTNDADYTTAAWIGYYQILTVYFQNLGTSRW